MSHNVKGCPMNKFNNNKEGACYRCGMKLHNKQRVHEGGDMGNRHCKHQNNIRALVVAWEDKALRAKLNSEHPDVAQCVTVGDYIDWLVNVDEDGALNYSKAVLWLHEHILGMQL